MQETTTVSDHLSLTDIAKQNIRQYLLHTDRWIRDNRCKKYETWKKTINGTTYRVQFAQYSVVLAAGLRSSAYGGKFQWRIINTNVYTDISRDYDVSLFFRFLPVESSYKETAEDKDNKEYLQRMGVI